MTHSSTSTVTLAPRPDGSADLAGVDNSQPHLEARTPTMPAVTITPPPTSPLAGPAASGVPRDSARLLAVLAYGGAMSWFGLVVSLPMYLWARRRGGSFVAWHALQATSISLWLVVLSVVAFATGLDRAWGTWGLPADVSVASPWLGQAAMWLASPRYLVLAAASLLCGAGIIEALCGRATSLPLVHGLADRYAWVRNPEDAGLGKAESP